MIQLKNTPIAGASLKRYPQGGITQFFGENLNNFYAQMGWKGHNGLDFAAVTRTPVLATHDGSVWQVFNSQDSSETKGYGVYVLHPEGWFTVYWHMLEPTCKPGDPIKAGDCLGYSDNTGQSTGPHLHFGLYPVPRDMTNGYDGAVDPLPYFQISLLTQILGLLQQVFKLKGQINQQPK